MPAKPRHKRGRLPPQARRRREETRGPATVAAAGTASATAGASAAASSPQAQSSPSGPPAAPAAPRASARPAKGTAASSVMQTISHQQVGTELRTIGIITAVLVVLLVVLSFVIR